MRRVNSGRSSPRALESAPIASSLAPEVSVEHGHRAETESLYSFESFSSEVERIAGITDQDITTKNAPVAVACLPEEMSGMFKRRQVIRSIVSKENLFRLNLLEQVDVPRFEEFSLNAAPELWPLFLAFKHIKNGSDMFFRASEQIIVQQYPAVSNRKFAQRAFTFRNGAEPAVIMTAARSDSVAMFEI